LSGKRNKKIDCVEIEKFKMMKVFRSFWMPDEAREVLFDRFHGTSIDCFKNDVHVKWDVFPIGKYKDELKENDDIIYQEDNIYFVRGDDLVSDWLYKNGALPYETVLIDYSY